MTGHVPGDDFYAGLPDDLVLSEPPTTELTDGTVLTLREWLTHFHPDGGRAWSAVTTDFYRAALRAPVVARHFGSVSVADTQRFFLTLQMIVVNWDGLTVADMRHLQRQPRPVFRCLPAETFTAVVAALCSALSRASTPDEAILAVVTATVPLRDAITTPRARRFARVPVTPGTAPRRGPGTG